MTIRRLLAGIALLAFVLPAQAGPLDFDLGLHVPPVVVDSQAPAGCTVTWLVADVANEFVTFLAKDAAGDTLVWFWGSTTGASHGSIPASSLAAGADVNANHLVDATELVHLATIIGVAPSSLTAADLV